MGQIDVLYWRLAVGCFVMGVFFFFMTAESLVQGKLRLPAWVFSSFTLVIGVFFFRIFLNSMSEFHIGQHGSLDELVDSWKMIQGFFN